MYLAWIFCPPPVLLVRKVVLLDPLILVELLLLLRFRLLMLPVVLDTVAMSLSRFSVNVSLSSNTDTVYSLKKHKIND